MRLSERAAAYSDFFAVYKIDPELQEKVVQLLVAEEMSGEDILKISRSQGLSIKETSELLRIDRQRALQEMRALVGNEVARGIYAYGASNAHQQYTNEFVNLCARSGLHPSSSAAERVGRMVSTTAATYSPTTQHTQAERQDALDMLALAELTKLLSRDELAVVEQMMKQRQTQVRQQPGG